MSPSCSQLSALCREAGWLFVYLETDRLCFDQIWTLGATHWSFSTVVYAYAHVHGISMHTLSHAHIAEAVWDDVRYWKKDGGGKRKKARERSLWCTQHFLCSYLKQQSQTVRGEAWKAFDDDWLTVQILPMWTRADGVKHRGQTHQLISSLRPTPTCSANWQIFFLLGFKIEHPAMVISSFHLRGQCIIVCNVIENKVLIFKKDFK